MRGRELSLKSNVLVGVGAHVDAVFRLRVPVRAGQSHPAGASEAIGGCAFNTAAALSGEGFAVGHLGVRGDDGRGDALARGLARYGIADLGLVVNGCETAMYAAFLEPDGSLAIAAAAMDIYARAGALDGRPASIEALAAADWLVLDANAPEASVALAAGRGKATRLALLATSAAKAPGLAPLLGDADVLFANSSEWRTLEGQGFQGTAFVTDGEKGARAIVNGREVARQGSRATGVVDVIGAGDAFAAGALAALIGGGTADDALERGLDRAARCLRAPLALGWLDREP